MHANRAAGKVGNAHQMVLVLLRGSLFSSSNLHTQNDVDFSLANPCPLLCTADVFDPLGTKTGSSDRFPLAIFCFTESPPPLCALPSQKCA